MKNLKYLIIFILVIIFFVIFKFLGPNLSSKFSGKIFEIIGPLFRSKKIIYKNIKRAMPNVELKEIKTSASVPNETAVPLAKEPE